MINSSKLRSFSSIQSQVRSSDGQTSLVGNAKTDFAFVGGGTIANPTEWGDWLVNRPAPTTKPGTRRYRISTYWYGTNEHEKIKLDFANRWGHYLDIGAYGGGFGEAIADAQLATPLTSRGRLVKLAMTNSSYRVGVGLEQKYPTAAEAPSGYTVVNGTRTNDWSPIADEVAMNLAVQNATAKLTQVKAAGIQVGMVYHGGESGLNPQLTDPPAISGDPAVVADKGALSWDDYISRRKSIQCKRFFDAVKVLAPERDVYVFYPCDADMYVGVPDALRLYGFYYEYMQEATELPSSSNYFYEFNADLADPDIKRNAYLDLATNSMSAISEQIERYNQPLCYNWIQPLGWYLNDNVNRPRIEKNRISHPLKARGYMKFSCITGSIGFIDAYFGVDCSPDFPAVYPVFDNLNPPPWIVSSTIIADEHARFSFFDEYIFDGDMLDGGFKHPWKNYSAYEFKSRKRAGFFFPEDPDVRIWVRKKRGQAKYLVLALAIRGNDKDVWIRTIDGVSPFKVRARMQGSIYTIDNTGGFPSVTWQDSPTPNPLDVPQFVLAEGNSTQIRLRYYAPRTLDANSPPPVGSFSVAGATISSITISHDHVLQDIVTINLVGNLSPGASTAITYNGNGLIDTESNSAPPLNTSFILPNIFTTFSAGLAYNGSVYYSFDRAPTWETSRMVSTVSLAGDGEVSADFYGHSQFALSPESTNTISLATGAYSINTGALPNGDYVVGAKASGTDLSTTGADPAFYYPLGDKGRIKLSRASGVVTASVRPFGSTTWIDVLTFPATSTAPLYLHGSIGRADGRLGNVQLVGFA